MSGNYVAWDGSSTGIGRDETGSTSSWQLFYEGEVAEGSFLAQVGYAYAQNVGLTIGTNKAAAEAGDSRHGFSIAAAWAPADSGIIPSVSGGYSLSNPDDSDEEITSWYAGFEWSDVGIEGNSFGTGIGQAPKIEDDYNMMWEIFYKFAVTDNITVTPTYFIIDEYSGSLTSDYVHGAYVKTTFTF